MSNTVKDFILVDGKDRYIYTIKDGRYYVQPVVYSHKYGITIPQSKKRISKNSYMVMYQKYCEDGER